MVRDSFRPACGLAWLTMNWKHAVWVVMPANIDESQEMDFYVLTGPLTHPPLTCVGSSSATASATASADGGVDATATDANTTPGGRDAVSAWMAVLSRHGVLNKSVLLCGWLVVSSGSMHGFGNVDNQPFVVLSLPPTQPFFSQF